MELLKALINVIYQLNHLQINSMILTQKGLRTLLLLTILLFLVAYILIAKKKIADIAHLYLVVYFEIAVFTILMAIACVLFPPKKKILEYIYMGGGMAVILFFIISIFTFKVEDVFFWDIKRPNYPQFFKYAFFLQGCNYVLGLPYIALVICEITFTKNRLIHR